ncbi:hypothetical protein N7448_004282 [Penicillium atrosanguineum]|uniref:DUF7721 domain-containing protein n=1 Tax=Penicillium atrosanguineum TaxID=1132637 RepID=A0A9W9H8Z9_9EURO|nr:choline/ethanolamine kinase [Penicillium atrosanguineum]KAJ5118071.1 hypothetical protein N7526_011094 [Penicillium atrosanguineum]KAJ5140874.1 hypothetical protein N7448_004282 [Penicillium atrosanguineum]KAJ5310786.1 choline/ethanolamine kinase [Penicillium atrosanguineum]KAJ5316310.1 hypothetical protein N7476_006617 [Penicillium atrosanguineum]
MSYNEYGSNNERSEYGGGGRGGNNYYDQSNDFSGRNEGQGYGREEQGQGYGRNEGQGYGRNEGQGYGGREEQGQGYGREEQGQGYGNQGQHGHQNQGQQEYRDTRYQGSEPYSGGDDFSSAAQHASQHDSGNSDLFSNALSFIQGRASSAGSGEIDERHAVQAHQAMYNGGNDEGQTHDSSTVGAGAAMQALKMFTGGGSSDGGMDKNKLIGMAMSQAGKLWDEKSGNGANMSGDKQSAINNAAEMALKMYMKSGGGIGGTGGAGGLMSLASKFLS